MYEIIGLFNTLIPAWTLPNSDLAASRRWLERRGKRARVASLQRHLGVPRALGNLSLRAAPAHPVTEKKKTASVSVGGDEGLMRGLTAQRESEAAAHRLSWDPWLSTGTGLPLSITNTGREQAAFDRSSVVSFCSTCAAPPLTLQQASHGKSNEWAPGLNPSS